MTNPNDDARRLAAQVLSTLAPEADLATVGDDEDLRQALDLDSMDFLNFVTGLQKLAGLPLASAEQATLHTLRGVAAWLRRARG